MTTTNTPLQRYQCGSCGQLSPQAFRSTDDPERYTAEDWLDTHPCTELGIGRGRALFICRES